MHLFDMLKDMDGEGGRAVREGYEFLLGRLRVKERGGHS